MPSKVLAYLGFAKKAGQLISGTNTCVMSMGKGRVCLMILTEDISENGRKKIMKTIRQTDTPYVEYGQSEEVSHMVGTSGRSVFGVTDRRFAETILKEIQRENDKGGCVNEDQGSCS